MHHLHPFCRGVSHRAYQLINRVGGAFLLYLLGTQGVQGVEDNILVVPVKCDMVSFFFHGLHLLLAFLLFGFRRLVLLHALIHIALDFSEDVTHRAKLSLERLHIHPVIFLRELPEAEAFGIYAVA